MWVAESQKGYCLNWHLVGCERLQGYCSWRESSAYQHPRCESRWIFEEKNTKTQHSSLESWKNETNIGEKNVKLKCPKNNNKMDISIKRNVTVTENGHFSIWQQSFCQWLNINDATMIHSNNWLSLDFVWFRWIEIVLHPIPGRLSKRHLLANSEGNIEKLISSECKRKMKDNNLSKYNQL